MAVRDVLLVFSTEKRSGRSGGNSDCCVVQNGRPAEWSLRDLGATNLRTADRDYLLFCADCTRGRARSFLCA